jgi:hypothetical protein
MWSEIKRASRKFVKTVWVTVGRTTETDPYEHTSDLVTQNPVPLEAIVKDLTSTQAMYKMVGVQVSTAKDLLLSKQFRQWIELSRFITIDNIKYYAFKDAEGSRVQIREMDDVIRVYVYSKAIQ